MSQVSQYGCSHYKGSPGTSMTIGFARQHDKSVLEFHKPDAVDIKDNSD